MKKYWTLGTCLIITFGLGVLYASTAGAVEFLLAEWLAAGAKITTAQASDSEGELEFVMNNGGGVKVRSVYLCSVIRDGTVGPASEDAITKILTLSGQEVSTTVLSGSGLECTNDENCASPKVWSEGLPWKTEAELMIDGTETFFVDLITSTVGYYVECTILGVKIAEECTAVQTAIELKNEGGGSVDGTFSDSFQTLAGLKLVNCTLGGAETGEVNGLGNTLLTSGTALTVSSE